MLSTLTTPDRFFRSQNQPRRPSAILSQSSMPSRPGAKPISPPGFNMRVRMTASLNATVIPPPVSGWRILYASPTMIAPDSDCEARPCIEGGRNEFGMVRNR